jgi:hypothetical protein
MWCRTITSRVPPNWRRDQRVDEVTAPRYLEALTKRPDAQLLGARSTSRLMTLRDRPPDDIVISSI